jgi:hypothetical protein
MATAARTVGRVLAGLALLWLGAVTWMAGQAFVAAGVAGAAPPSAALAAWGLGG